ncbi:hypothetical protein L484_014652 [Morus notabilis]|uniref:Uncharacterized protein n=1 Tax=Morus notabilis TaxID=981085 RepID=W9RUV4_9ROSA|nr:hypothetical protein L484_014652 [Morus notabilis]
MAREIICPVVLMVPGVSMMDRGPGPLPIHFAALEEELEIQHREMHRIVAENRLVIDDNMLLRKELTDTKDEIYRLRELEADLDATSPSRAEVVQLRAGVEKLNASRQELSSQVQGLTKSVNQFKDKNQQLVSMRTDIDALRKELVEARRICEYEKKAKEEQVEQKQAMETNLVFMAREVEKLRAQCLNAEEKTSSLDKLR